MPWLLALEGTVLSKVHGLEPLTRVEQSCILPPKYIDISLTDD